MRKCTAVVAKPSLWHVVVCGFYRRIKYTGSVQTSSCIYLYVFSDDKIPFRAADGRRRGSSWTEADWSLLLNTINPHKRHYLSLKYHFKSGEMLMAKPVFDLSPDESHQWRFDFSTTTEHSEDNKVHNRDLICLMKTFKLLKNIRSENGWTKEFFRRYSNVFIRNTWRFLTDLLQMYQQRATESCCFHLDSTEGNRTDEEDAPLSTVFNIDILLSQKKVSMF